MRGLMGVMVFPNNVIFIEDHQGRCLLPEHGSELLRFGDCSDESLWTVTSIENHCDAVEIINLWSKDGETGSSPLCIIPSVTSGVTAAPLGVEMDPTDYPCGCWTIVDKWVVWEAWCGNHVTNTALP
jgi:hypothetical protein